MARNRMIKPEFWEDEKIGSLSSNAKLLFIACLNFADDEGLIRWNTHYLAAVAFMYDETAQDNIKDYMTELEQAQLIYTYRTADKKTTIGWIINFHKHQRIDKPQPSKFPPPNIQNPEIKKIYAEREKMRCYICGKEMTYSDETNISDSKRPSLDHVKPKSKGGTDYPSNIRAVHISCNKSKGNKEQFQEQFQELNQEQFQDENKIEIENKININKNNIKEKINKREKRTPEQETVPDSPKQIELLPAPETGKPKKIAKPRKVTPQEIVVQYFAEKYKLLTGIDYLATEKDYSIVGKKLIPKYNIELIKQKIDWLVVGCTHPKVYWFAKDVNNFLIGTLESHWNEILPVLTDKQRKQQEKQKEEAERKAKVMAELAKQGIKIAETAQNSTEVGHVRV